MIDDINTLKNDNASLLAQIERLNQELADRSAFEESLQEKESFNFALFNYSPALTVIVDKTGRVLRSNRAKRESGDRLPLIGDIMYKDYANHHSVDMYSEMMAAMETQKQKSFPELKYQNKYISITISPFPHGAIIVSEDITRRKIAENDRINLIVDLNKALAEVETLHGLLPICAHCKKIRDDKGLWNNIEEYISRHSFADFSHTLCPGCVQLHYPEVWAKKMQKLGK